MVQIKWKKTSSIELRAMWSLYGVFLNNAFKEAPEE